MSAAASERTLEVKNPANGATIARAAEGDKVDIDAAVRAARRRSSRDPSSPAGAARWARRFLDNYLATKAVTIGL